ncbi:MAG: TRAP transporter fused permease subunit [Chloroflexi bacterium]|nr:TRAP transporter fused permease subunit [Chloroflexota bacterium]
MRSEEILSGQESRLRALPGVLGILQRVLICLIPIVGILFILNLQTYLNMAIFPQQYLGLMFALTMTGTFLSIPGSKSAAPGRLPWYDGLLALAGVPAGLYLAVRYSEIAVSLGEISMERAILGVVAILLVLEGLRRLVGWVLVIVVTLIILYSQFANFFPGPLQGMPVPWERMSAYLYADPGAMLRMLEIAAGIALGFTIFGQALVVFGGGKQLTDMAVVSLGRFRGAPAKAAILSSSLMGTMSGSAVANVLITGSVTIPMMIRSGYRAALAGAVEAIASSGGQIMPPVMGITAFLIADNLGIPYADVALAALVPALLFYLVVFVQVDLEAGKDGMRGLAPSEIPKAGLVLRQAWVVLPCIATLIYFLFVARMDPGTAGLFSGAISVPFLMLAPGGRGRLLKRLVEVIETSGRMFLEFGAVLAAAGFIVGVASNTGLGFNLAYTLTEVGQGNILLLLGLAAVTCIILGMGMPSLPAYALLAALVAPAMVSLGIEPLAAHLFIFYFSVVSNWTPPVALACFAASAISRANPNRIGLIAVRLGILAYIIPFLFVFSPALLLQHSTMLEIAVSLITAALGTFILGVGLVGFLRRRISSATRLMFGIAGIALLIPLKADAGWVIYVNIVGLMIGVSLFVYEWRKGATSPQVVQLSVE